MRIIITGGSGFIGTNLIEFYLTQNHQIKNIDIKGPKIESHNAIWENIDVRDFNSVNKLFSDFNPELVIHLAARADLRGKSLDDYDTNTIGVKNIMEVSNLISSIRKVVFASSMLVCKAGYIPKDMNDYCPPNFYGESKVIGEQIVKENSIKLNYEWVIVRPSSIWGPWFGPTYKGFFDLIIRRRYFNFSGRMAIKTYGYIDNTIYQIDCIVKGNSNEVVLYLGDYMPVNIKEWAIEIGNEVNFKPYTIPNGFIIIAAKIGDLLGNSILKFPMNSFRLQNMTTDNVIPLDETKLIAPDLPFTRLEGTKKTIKWLELQSNAK
jgi:nucleoside-diphosphate-sugar epimerase